MNTLLHRLLLALRRSRLDTDLREEIESHRAHRQDAFERHGIAADEAARASRRALGNVTLAVEDARDVWAVRAADTAWQDVRAALGGLRKSPSFALVAIGTLALGIGANTALFSIFNSLILRQLPARDPEQLVILSDGSWTYPIWDEIRKSSDRLFDGAFAWSEEHFDLAGGGQSTLVEGAYVSGGMFEVLGVHAARGRTILPSDDLAGSTALVAVVSHRFWQEHFGGTPDVVGLQLTLKRIPFTVIGVLPREFLGPTIGESMDVMVPFAAEPVIRGGDSVLHERSTWWVEIMARLRPGQTLEQANLALRAVQPGIREATAPDWPAAMLAHYLEDPFTLVRGATGQSPLRNRFETPLTAMIVAVGLVLLVACASIASLLLARALARRHELSVRLALGASRWRLVRLLFTESLIVAASGAAAGLVFARWSSALLVEQLNTWQGAVTLNLALDWRVLAFATALACGSALAAGLAPLAGLRNVAPGEALKDTGRAIAGDRHFLLRGTLVVAQIALSLVLVVAAGLFLRTFTALAWMPLGFQPAALVVADIDLQPSRVAPAERADLMHRLRDAAAAVPGVTSAAISRMTPLSGGGWNNWVGDSEAPPADRSRMTWINATTPGWFRTMGIPLLAGRDLEPGDRVGKPSVAIVNESFARRFLTGRPPLGETVDLGGRGMGPYVVVGIVADAVYRRPREGMMPTMYLPIPPAAEWSRVALAISLMPGQHAAVERQVASALTRVDPSVAFSFRTFDQLLEGNLTQERLVALLSTFFGGLALLIAALGLYGLVAQGVRTRQAEIGLRMALGAAPSSIMRLVFQRVGVLMAAGLALGLAASLWAARFVGDLLFHVEARDRATFAGAAAVLIAVGVLAAWLPARRAARLDPARVLREG